MALEQILIRASDEAAGDESHAVLSCTTRAGHLSLAKRAGVRLENTSAWPMQCVRQRSQFSHLGQSQPGFQPNSYNTAKLSP